MSSISSSKSSLSISMNRKPIAFTPKFSGGNEGFDAYDKNAKQGDDPTTLQNRIDKAKSQKKKKEARAALATKVTNGEASATEVAHHKLSRIFYR